MQYFTNEYISFFKELASNNHKDWFHENKKRYESHVKKPFENFISALISEISQEENDLTITAKECIMRINRDIRFSKDKTPYNLQCTAIISPAGKKDKSIPGTYIRFSAENIWIMGGCYGPSKEQLTGIRSVIDNDPKHFRNIIEEAKFQQEFGALKGDEIKRIPKEWQEAHQKEALIAKKQFYFVAERKADNAILAYSQTSQRFFS